jgi:16S rRNA C967 or C1407 C5-methylase (RsmB/RsmF family)
MRKKASPLKGQEAFLGHFAQIYGSRWPELYAALQSDSRHVAYNPFNLPKPYFLDEASIVAAQALPVEQGYRVLDMCAAPGGKALVLASALETGSLVANERSAARRSRLKRVIEEHLPDSLKKLVTITGYDAARIGMFQPNAYDAILLDAPCSSERHLLKSPELLKDWTARRSGFLAVRQYAMLVSAMLAAKPGGYILYATCSLSPTENDDVIRRILIKKKDKIKSINAQPSLGEATEFGKIILPDTAAGAGPLYFALLQTAGS